MADNVDQVLKKSDNVESNQVLKISSSVKQLLVIIDRDRQISLNDSEEEKKESSKEKVNSSLNQEDIGSSETQKNKKEEDKEEEKEEEREEEKEEENLIIYHK